MVLLLHNAHETQIIHADLAILLALEVQPIHLITPCFESGSGCRITTERLGR